MKNNIDDSIKLLINEIDNNPDTNILNTKLAIFEDSLNEDEQNKIKSKAKEFLEFISDKDMGEIRSILETITIEDVEELENSSELLMSRVGQLDSIKDTTSSNVANILIKLNSEISDINPHKFNLQANKIVSWIPFLGKPIDRYLKKFKTAKELISETIHYLEDGEQLLKDDNIVLQHDKKRYKEKAIKLQRKGLVFEKVVSIIEDNLTKLDEKDREFYENNLLLNLHKKLRSIYEILVVTQEGFLSSELIINTNWELIDNIANVRIVTRRALETGVAMLVALENQKNVLNAVEKTKEVTNELILNNAKTMNSQAAQIYSESGNGTISIETLKEAFTQIDEAMSKIDQFKKEAVVKIKDEVNGLKIITNQLDDKIKNAEKIELYKNSLSLEI